MPLVVFPAEGPSYCVGLDHQMASAVARQICASLAAAPCRAVDGQGKKQVLAGGLPSASFVSISCGLQTTATERTPQG
jgi:hypothetical protein